MSNAQREIFSQYDALEKTKDLLSEQKEEIKSILGHKNDFVFFGCGSSYSIAKSGAAIAGMYGAGKAAAVAAGDYIINYTSYRKMLDNSCVVMISRSGMTTEMIIAAQYIKQYNPDTTIVSICATADAPIKQYADYSIEIPWAFDVSICQTRTISNLYMAIALMLGAIYNDSKLYDDFSDLISRGEKHLELSNKLVSPLSKREWVNSVVLADAQTAGIAEEGALAFNEICMRRSNYYHVLDSRHGPMVLFDENTLVIVLLSSAESEKQTALLADIKKRGSCLLCVSSDDSFKEADILVKIPDYNHIVKGVALLNVIQVLTLAISVESGVDPDKPTGLDPWIKL